MVPAGIPIRGKTGASIARRRPAVRGFPLANAGPAVAGLLLFYGVKRLRPLVGGLAIGSAALLAQMAISGDVAFVFGSLGLRAFAVLNALVCFWIAKVTLDEK